MENAIPEKVALDICELVRERNKNKRLSFTKGQCWGCMKVSIKKADVKVRCIFGLPDNRGCHLVNKVYDNENYNLD
ncbi:MAG: hypothetical protein ACFFKA_19740 [Candidatus Thorarchaeota archaeon]